MATHSCFLNHVFTKESLRVDACGPSCRPPPHVRLSMSLDVAGCPLARKAGRAAVILRPLGTPSAGSKRPLGHCLLNWTTLGAAGPR